MTTDQQQLEMTQENFFQIEKKEIILEQEIMNDPPSHHVLRSILSTEHNPLETINLKLTVHGVHSIPEKWRAKIVTFFDDPTEQQYNYEVRFCGAHLKNGKQVPKEMTEEEKKAAEEAKSKKPPPKPDPKKKGQEEEPSQEEKDRIEQERLQKEQELQERIAAWNELDDQTKFFRTCEDPFKEGSIKFGSEETRFVEIELEQNSSALASFEAQVNGEQGGWLYFDKVPPPEDDDPKAKKAAPKKGQPVEELKPFFAKAWVDLTPFKYPGSTETTQRCLIKTIPPETEAAPEGEEQPPPPELPYDEEQTYILIEIQLSSPVNPIVDEEQVPDTERIIDGFLRPPPSPSTIEATDEFKREIHQILLDINLEYTKKFTTEEKDDNPAGSPRPKSTTTGILSTAQLREIRDTRKEEFLVDFTTSGKYLTMREKLKKVLFRIAVEKYKKTAGPEGLKGVARDKFKAELYSFLTEQMKCCLSFAVDLERPNLHIDLSGAKDYYQQEKENQRKKCFIEDEDGKFQRLVKEFNIIQDKQNAEKNLQNLVMNKPNDQSIWYQYCQFCLGQGMQVKAEEHLRKVVKLEGQCSEENRLFYAALRMQREQYREALKMINGILDEDWLHYNANLMMGILQDLLQRPNLQRKYFAIAKVKKMRELNKLPPKSQMPTNFRTEALDYRYVDTDWKKEKTNDEKLEDDHSDQLFYDLIEFLLSKSVFDVSDMALGYIKDKLSVTYFMTKARIRVGQFRYLEAVESLDALLRNDPNNQKAWVLRGHAFFSAGNLFDSEESYIKALRIKPPPRDQMIQERLGIVYAKRKSWKDARVVFQKCCKEFTSTTSWFHLGLSLLRLGEIALAEDAFTQANILDNLNPKPWAYMAILCMTMGKDREVQAELCYKEAIRMGLNDSEILEELGDLYVKEKIFPMAVICYERVVNLDETNGDGWRKLGDVHCNSDNKQSERDLAIEAYKHAIQHLDGETNKSKVALTLQELLQMVGREDEIEPFRKYLLDQTISDDEDGDNI